MNDQRPPPLPGSISAGKKPKGFFAPRLIRAATFYIISTCIVASIVVCILAIWDFAKTDAFWRLIATFVVVAVGTALFATVNGIFGEDQG